MERYRYLVVVAMGTVLCAASVSAEPAGGAPSADGSVGAGEYATVVKNGDVALFFTITADTVYAAIEAPTQGWVAIGLGASRMDGATMFLGAVDSSGTPQFLVQKGRFHRHSDFEEVTPTAHAVGRTAAATTLEVALLRDAVLPPSKTNLSYVYAYGSSLDMTEHHAFRASGSLPIP